MLHEGVREFNIDKGVFLVLFFFLFKDNDAVVDFLEHVLHLFVLPRGELVLEEQMGLGGEHGVADGGEQEANEPRLHRCVSENSRVDMFSFHFVHVDLILQIVLSDQVHHRLGERVPKPV